MKLKNIYRIFFIILMIFSFSFKVTADSGWDSDYGGGFDFGGGYDSNSWDFDFDYGHDYDWDNDTTYHSSSSSSDDPFLGYIIMVLIIIMIVASIVQDIKPHNYQKPKYHFNDIPEDKFLKFFPNNTIEEFRNMALQNFIAVQNAWMNFDYDTLRKLCTDELYNSYITELNVLKLKSEQNIMNDFKCLELKLLNIKEENNIITLYFYLNITFFDYVVDKNKKVVRGNNLYKLNNHYYLHYVRNKTGEDKITNCPNCGAPLDKTTSQTCPYCGSVIIKEASNFVLSKKMKVDD